MGCNLLSLLFFKYRVFSSGVQFLALSEVSCSHILSRFPSAVSSTGVGATGSLSSLHHTDSGGVGRWRGGAASSPRGPSPLRTRLSLQFQAPPLDPTSRLHLPMGVSGVGLRVLNGVSAVELDVARISHQDLGVPGSVGQPGRPGAPSQLAPHPIRQAIKRPSCFSCLFGTPTTTSIVPGLSRE